jgi:hypothetical protein
MTMEAASAEKYFCVLPRLSFERMFQIKECDS